MMMPAADLDMIVQESAPCLRGRVSSFRHQPCYGPFRDLDPKFEQFPVDSGTSPSKRKSSPMPPDDRFRLGHDERLAPFLPEVREAGPEKPVSPTQSGMSTVAFQDCQLLLQRKVFESQLSLTP